MRYRKLDKNSDYTFGQAKNNFFIDVPESVAQAVKTRLLLIQGEFFLDTSVGTPYNSRILGAGRVSTFSSAIRQVILDTQGVTGITKYSAFFNAIIRKASVSATIDTLYGKIDLGQIL